MNCTADILNSDYEVFYRYLVKLIPEVGKLKNKDVRKMQKKIYDRYSKLLSSSELKNHSLIDLVLMCASSDEAISEHGFNVINAINNLFEECLSIAKQKSRIATKIQGKIREALVSIENGISENNNDFINHINELAFLRYIKKCNNIELIEIEEKLPNNRSIDFVIRHNIGKSIGFEIMTIQNINPIGHSTESLTNFVAERINCKYSYKTEGLECQEISKLDDIRVVAILQYQDGLEKFDMSYVSNKSFPLFMSCLHKDDDKWEYDVDFAPVVLKTIIENGIQTIAIS